MYARQYEITLPADYDMTIIERRIATRGPSLHDLPGFGRKAYAVRPRLRAEHRLLLLHWRVRGWPVVFVRHDSLQPGSPLAPGQPGNDFKPVVARQPDLLVVKHVNSAFGGEPDFHEWLQLQRWHRLLICGVTTNHCCETTARIAANLGYEVWFALDATHTFDRRDLEGEWISADELARYTAANLQGELTTVLDTAGVMGRT